MRWLADTLCTTALRGGRERAAVALQDALHECDLQSFDGLRSQNNGMGIMMAILQFSPRHAGSMLRAMRKSRGWTLRELAQRTTLSVAFLSDIERGRTDPSMLTLEKLAVAHGGAVVISFEYKDETLPLVQALPNADVGNLINQLRITAQDLEALLPSRKDSTHAGD